MTSSSSPKLQVRKLVFITCSWDVSPRSSWVQLCGCHTSSGAVHVLLLCSWNGTRKTMSHRAALELTTSGLHEWWNIRLWSHSHAPHLEQGLPEKPCCLKSNLTLLKKQILYKINPSCSRYLPWYHLKLKYVKDKQSFTVCITLYQNQTYLVTPDLAGTQGCLWQPEDSPCTSVHNSCTPSKAW